MAGSDCWESITEDNTPNPLVTFLVKRFETTHDHLLTKQISNSEFRTQWFIGQPIGETILRGLNFDTSLSSSAKNTFIDTIWLWSCFGHFLAQSNMVSHSFCMLSATFSLSSHAGNTASSWILLMQPHEYITFLFF